MVTIKYRLLGNNTVTLDKTFTDKAAYNVWFQNQVNIVVLSIEYTGVETLNKLFG